MQIALLNKFKLMKRIVIIKTHITMEKMKINEKENEAVLFDTDKYWESFDAFMMWQNYIF